jgi:hypothetical protein
MTIFGALLVHQPYPYLAREGKKAVIVLDMRNGIKNNGRCYEYEHIKCMHEKCVIINFLIFVLDQVEPKK